ncbi:MAG: rRNA maturation RNase YbeY [bacterium]
MKLSISFVEPIPKEFSLSAGQQLFAAWQKLEQPHFDGTIVVSFVAETDMKQLHKQSYGIEKSTDVLSFRYADSSGDQSAAGEIVICAAVARRYARVHKLAVENELLTLLCHGLLHLNDLDHATDQERVIFEEKTRGIMDTIMQESVSLWLA